MQFKIITIPLKIFTIILFGLVSTHVLAQQTMGYQLYKGVVVDANNENIYIINPISGIDALSTKKGNLVWHTETAQLPVAVYGSQLIAQQKASTKGQLSLAQIDSITGILEQQKLLELPNEIIPSIKQSLIHEFNLSSYGAPSNKLVWDYQSRSAQGMVVENQALVHMKFGEISLGKGNQINNAQLKTLATKPKTKVKITEGNFLTGLQGRQFRSVDERYILLSQLKQKGTIWDKYTWDLYDLKGQQLGHLENAHSYRPFIIIDGIILFVSLPFEKAEKTSVHSFPLLLNAYSITSGKKIWGTEVRDLRFTGQYPQ